jgi:hypothetical protein
VRSERHHQLAFDRFVTLDAPLRVIIYLSGDIRAMQFE